MGPPPEFDKVFLTHDVDGSGNRLFLAAAVSIDLENKKDEQLGVRARKRLAKQLRQKAFEQGMAMTYLQEASQVFGLGDVAADKMEEKLTMVRDIIQSFLDHPNQQATPSRFGDDYQQVDLMLPQLLAKGMERILFVSTTGKQGLVRYDGFSSVTNTRFELKPLLVNFDVRTYQATSWVEGYEDFLPGLEARLEEDTSFVKEANITRALSIHHYLTNHRSTREFT